MIFIQEAGSLKVLRQRAIHVLRAGVKACLLVGFATTVHPQISVTGVSGGNPSAPLAQQTDQQIGTLLQHWPELDAIQRRDLLAEVRKRMHLAKKAEANLNNTNPQNPVPSLTLRIKKAQTQHSYGRVANRGIGNLGDETVTAPKSKSAQKDSPREMMIRTMVTKILPDGSRLVREQTLVPGMQAYRSSEKLPASASRSDSPLLNGSQTFGGDFTQSRSGKVRVIRTTVRFGAGFDQRSRRATMERHQEEGVRRVSTPQQKTLKQRTASSQR